MRNHSMHIAAACFALGVTAASVGADSTPPRPVAEYRMQDGAGGRVKDSSGQGNDGQLLGGGSWFREPNQRALVLNGQGRVQVPAASMKPLGSTLSISAWVKGNAAHMRLVDGVRDFRGPSFQVCGDRIYLVTNDDFYPSRKPDEAPYDEKSLEHHDPRLWTGSADINLGDWTYQQQMDEPLSGIEPKLQVVGDRIYYEYFGQGADKAWQIWTASSALDGSDWKTVQRTQETHGYRVEQDNNIQVAGSRLFIGYPQKDQDDVWQLWTASQALDGSDYKAVKRTEDHGWIPALQVVGDHVYYMYVAGGMGDEHKGKAGSAAKMIRGMFKSYSLYMAVSDIDGGNWKVLRKLTSSSWYGTTGWGTFRVHEGSIYLSYPVTDGKGYSHLYTGSMGLDGGGLSLTRRTMGAAYAGAPRGSLEVVGNKLYYAFSTIPDDPAKRREAAAGKGYTIGHGDHGFEYWTATSALDGSHWSARRVQSGTPAFGYAYKGLQVVGAKLYIETMRLHEGPGAGLQEALGVSGANIVSKGDSFGIGVTEEGQVRAFINAGEDYLFRGEAPQDVAGAIAEAPLPLGQTWHQLAMTYDGEKLSLFVDGEARGQTPYRQKPGANPFPLLIGDGWQGLVSDVSVYDSVLNPDQVKTLYADHAH